MHGNLSKNAAAAAAPAGLSPDLPSDHAPDHASDLPSDHAPGAPPSRFPHADRASSHLPPGHSPDIRVLHLADRDATLRRATGSDDARVHGWLVNDLSFALNMPPGLDRPGFTEHAREDRVCAAVAAMCDIGPRDTLEGMLAAQMIAVHSAALDSLRRAAEPDSADRARDADLRHAARLLNVFQRQMRVRDDRRNPVLARSLTGRHAPGAANHPPAAPVAPAGEALPNDGKHAS